MSNPNHYPYNNMTRAELLAEAERTDNKLALALAQFREHSVEDMDEADNRIDELRDVLREVENDAGFESLSPYTKAMVEEHSI